MNQNHTEDSLLINKARQGNKEALNILMTKYYPRVYASLYAYTKSKEDAEDLAQATFIKAWKALESFRGDSAFFTWLYRIAINLAKNHFQSSAFKKQKMNISEDERVYEIEDISNVETDLMHEDSLRRINSFIQTLPENLRTSFALREVEGKSYEEIAIITDTPIGTVRSRIFRARETILEYINTELNYG